MRLRSPEDKISTIKPDLISARERDFSAKLFFAFMRKVTQEGVAISDIGSQIEVDDSEKKLIQDVLERAHSESMWLEEHMKYASSWGTIRLRQAITGFFEKRGVKVDPANE